MRVYLETLGCRLNFAEMASLGRQLAGAGHAVVGSADEADVCVLNSCAVTGEAARKSRQLARQLAHANPAGRLIVTGCYATLEGQSVAALPNVALVVGNSAKDGLLDAIEGLGLSQQGSEAQPFEVSETSKGSGIQGSGATPSSFTGSAAIPHPSSSNPDRTRAFIKVQDGCHNRCTFCIVTVARGEERSRPAADVVAEINALEAQGYQEAVLTGVHLGAYGQDRGESLYDLVATLLARTTIPRLRLSSLEPFDLAPEFFALWPQSGGRLMPHLHLPAQSGSDRVLRRMARRNRAADFEALAEAARGSIPGVTLTTDLIVGFPGESEDDLAETIAFARRIEFAHMHVFPYSARAGTPAARMGGQLPESERRRRSRLLNELDAELGKRARAGFVGQARPVLWENRERGLGAAPKEGSVTWSGLTDNYLRVQATAPEGSDLHNRITLTRLDALEGENLVGRVLGDCQAASPDLHRDERRLSGCKP